MNCYLSSHSVRWFLFCCCFGSVLDFLSVSKLFYYKDHIFFFIYSLHFPYTFLDSRCLLTTWINSDFNEEELEVSKLDIFFLLFILI